MKPSACKTNINHNHNNRKLASRPRYLICTLRHCDSDDAGEYLNRGDAFCPYWMSMRIRKHNEDHGPTPKKELKFMSPPPMEPTMTKYVL